MHRRLSGTVAGWRTLLVLPLFSTRQSRNATKFSPPFQKACASIYPDRKNSRPKSQERLALWKRRSERDLAIVVLIGLVDHEAPDVVGQLSQPLIVVIP